MSGTGDEKSTGASVSDTATARRAAAAHSDDEHVL